MSSKFSIVSLTVRILLQFINNCQHTYDTNSKSVLLLMLDKVYLQLYSLINPSLKIIIYSFKFQNINHSFIVYTCPPTISTNQGTFGTVKPTTIDTQNYAIKFTTCNNAYDPHILSNIFDQETQILSELSHPKIIKFYSSIKQGSYMKDGKKELKSGLVFEYAPYNFGQVLEFDPLNETIARTLFHQMLYGLNYLQGQNIIHRDIKPQNILFDAHYTLKICILGLSVKVANESKHKTIYGFDSFLLPEVIISKNNNGVINYLLAAGAALFILISSVSDTPNNGFYKFLAINQTYTF